MITVRLLTLILLSLGATAFAKDPEAAGPDASADPPVLVVHDREDVAQLSIDTTEIGTIRKRFNEALADLPQGYSLRMTLREHWSNHPAHYGLNAYPYSLVALDSEGRPDGIETVWDGHRVQRLIPWRHGEKHGVEKEFGPKGIVLAEIPWHEGELHGARKTYHPDGKLRSVTTYEHGVATGMSKTFDAAGNILREAPMKEGERHGVVTDYWPGTDQPKRQIPYENGEVEGEVRDFYKTGRLKRRLGFRNSRMHGVEEQFEADGTLVRTRWWLEGELVDQATYEAATK